MTTLTHTAAQEWILSGRALSGEEAALLGEHLAGCAPCRDFAGFHQVLLKEVPKVIQTMKHTEAEVRRRTDAALASLKQQRSTSRFFHGARAVAFSLSVIVLVALLVFLIVRLIPEGQRVPGKLEITPMPGSLTPAPSTPTAALTPLMTRSLNLDITITPLAETVYAQTQNASKSLTDIEIVGTLQATVLPNSLQNFISPDGKFKAEVVVYGCTNIQRSMNEEGPYSYEILKITDLKTQKETIIDSQVLYCNGVGAGGLGGLFWSTNSRYFYYTTAREGVPDGSGGVGWMRLASRFDITTGEKISLSGLEFSPDQSKVAAGDGIDMVVWDLQGNEIARFPGKDIITDQSIQAWVTYFAWSPDGKSLAYIIRISSNMTSDVLVASLSQKQSMLLLVSSTPEFVEVHWKDQNHLSLSGWDLAVWEYDLANKSLIPPSKATATPQAATLITPIANGPSIGSYPISPDSHWLPYVDFDQKTLHFYDLSASSACDFPTAIGNPDPYRFLAWLADGRVAVQADGQVLAGKPCSSFAPAAPQEKLALDHQDPSFSPDARYQAVENFSPNTQGPNQTTTIKEVATGTTVAEATYVKLAQGGGTITGEWIDSSHFLIPFTGDQGPLLLAPGKPVVNVAADIFHLPIKPGSGQFDLWSAISDVDNQTSGPFHLMLIPTFGSSNQQASNPLQIYHSETGKVETLPYLVSEGAFRGDGHWLLVTTVTPQGEKTLYRPIDPPGSTLQPIDVDIQTPPWWSPDGSQYYQVSQDQTTIAVYSFPGNVLIGSWQAPEYELSPSWSPDGKYLAVWGRKHLDYNQEAIFVIRL